MFTIQGKYNSALVTIDTIDDTTRDQIQGFVDCEVFADGNIVIMPDCHFGKAACIGFTGTMTDKIVPNMIGVDIGCGMTAYKMPVKDMDFQELDNIIRQEIPCGFNIHESPDANLNAITADDALSFMETSEKIGQREGRVIESLGTLGGCNHFIEVGKAPDGYLWLVVHSGSRNFGLSVANYHQRKAKAYVESCTIDINVPQDMEFLVGCEMLEYLVDMQLAQTYAGFNRSLMIRRITDALKFDFIRGDFMDCVHNYVSQRDNIIRKGAISAQQGEEVIIPLNMRDGIIFGTGKGNAMWNYSACHGAGRVLSRSKAKKTLSIEAYKEEMVDVWSSCVCEETLDESPSAYKDMDMIVDALDKTIDINFIAKPVYNFKG